MSFTGVTFAQQKVLPSDDAVIRRKMLSDGILYGCEISYSGSTLTMGAGQLMACGRQFRHPSAENWAVADATSGFARLVLTVDLTRTASKEVFDQVVSSIEYATAQDGFPDLNQSDVNTTGSQYQIVACVVSLGAGGITGIVESLSSAAHNGVVLDLLWENASPGSEFAAQEIALNLSSYSHIMIEFVAVIPAMLIRKGMNTYAMSTDVTSTDSNSVVVDLRRRLISFADDGVSIGNNNRTLYTTTTKAFGALSTYNASSKPFRIYGLRGVPA